MPAFDPVRDAVLNSPSISAHTPPHADRPAQMRIQLPSSSPTSERTGTPGLARRATDLAAVLNPAPALEPETPLFTPTTPRPPATLSHLLLPSDGDDQLSSVAPLRRRSSDVSSSGASAREGSYFSHSGPGGSSIFTPESSPLVRASASLALPGTVATIGTESVYPSGPVSAPVHAFTPAPTRSPVAPTLSNIISSSPLAPIYSSHSAAASSNVSAVSAPAAPSHGMLPPPLPPQHARPATPSTLEEPVKQGIVTPAPVLAPAPSMPPPRKTSSPVTAKVPPKPQPPMQHALPPKPQTALPPRSPPKSAASPVPKRGKEPTPIADAGPLPGVKRSTIPYAPTRRRTPAASVLVPLSPAEMERYKNFPGGVGTMLLRKRRRDSYHEGEKVDGLEDDSEEPRKKRKVGDVGLVVEHYNARPDVGVDQRQGSPIIGLKSFNNWVKSVLITRFAHPALSSSPEEGGRGQRGRVLDLGCGKGGDLTKWSKARVKEYVGVDIAAISVDQARLRHASLRHNPRFAASFFALDCYSHSLTTALPSHLFAQPFDVVSMQFCMHYAFESEVKARCMLSNVSGSLRRGGIFVGTVPDAAQLLERLDALPPNTEELSFGNSVYQIRFEDRHHRPLFGHRYWFFLKDAVDDVPEYVVQWDNFVSMAEEYSLYLVYKKEFHQVFEEHHEDHEFGQLLERMHVVDTNGESQMDEDQWEAANIYVAFAFEKR